MYQKDKPKNGLFLSNCLKFRVNYLCFKIFFCCAVRLSHEMFINPKQVRK